MISHPRNSLLFAAAIGAGLLVSSASHAQAVTSLEQAEVAGLSPEMRDEVQSRMKQSGQTVNEILTTILLNSIKLKHLGSAILALDFTRGIAVVKTASGGTELVKFDPRTLQIMA